MVPQAVARQVGVTRTVEVLGQEVALTDAGSGDPTVLLVHGIPTDHCLWSDVVPVVSQRARVLAVGVLGSQ